MDLNINKQMIEIKDNESSNLSESIDGLRKELWETQRELKVTKIKLEASNIQLNAEKARESDVVKHSEREFQILEKKLQNAESALRRYEQMGRDEAMVTNAMSMREFQEVLEEYNALKNQVLKLGKEIETKSNIIVDLSHELQKYRSIAPTNIEQVAATREILFEERLKILQASFDDKMASVNESFEQEKQAFLGRIRDLEIQLIQAEEMVKLNALISQSNGDSKSIVFTELQNEVISLRSIRAILQKQAQDKRNECKLLKQSNDTICNEFKLYISKHLNMVSTFESKMNDIQQLVSSKESKLKQLSAVVIKSKLLLASLRKSNDQSSKSSAHLPSRSSQVKGNAISETKSYHENIVPTKIVVDASVQTTAFEAGVVQEKPPILSDKYCSFDTVVKISKETQTLTDLGNSPDANATSNTTKTFISTNERFSVSQMESRSPDLLQISKVKQEQRRDENDAKEVVEQIIDENKLQLKEILVNSSKTPEVSEIVDEILIPLAKTLLNIDKSKIQNTVKQRTVKDGIVNTNRNQNNSKIADVKLELLKRQQSSKANDSTNSEAVVHSYVPNDTKPSLASQKSIISSIISESLMNEWSDSGEEDVEKEDEMNDETNDQLQHQSTDVSKATPVVGNRRVSVQLLRVEDAIAKNIQNAFEALIKVNQNLNLVPSNPINTNVNEQLSSPLNNNLSLDNKFIKSIPNPQVSSVNAFDDDLQQNESKSHVQVTNEFKVINSGLNADGENSNKAPFDNVETIEDSDQNLKDKDNRFELEETGQILTRLAENIAYNVLHEHKNYVKTRKLKKKLELEALKASGEPAVIVESINNSNTFVVDRVSRASSPITDDRPISLDESTDVHGLIKYKTGYTQTIDINASESDSENDSSDDDSAIPFFRQSSILIKKRPKVNQDYQTSSRTSNLNRIQFNLPIAEPPAISLDHAHAVVDDDIKFCDEQMQNHKEIGVNESIISLSSNALKEEDNSASHDSITDTTSADDQDAMPSNRFPRSYLLKGRIPYSTIETKILKSMTSVDTQTDLLIDVRMTITDVVMTDDSTEDSPINQEIDNHDGDGQDTEINKQGARISRSSRVLGRLPVIREIKRIKTLMSKEIQTDPIDVPNMKVVTSSIPYPSVQSINDKEVYDIFTNRRTSVNNLAFDINSPSNHLLKSFIDMEEHVANHETSIVVDIFGLGMNEDTCTYSDRTSSSFNEVSMPDTPQSHSVKLMETQSETCTSYNDESRKENSYGEPLVFNLVSVVEEHPRKVRKEYTESKEATTDSFSSAIKSVHNDALNKADIDQKNLTSCYELDNPTNEIQANMKSIVTTAQPIDSVVQKADCSDQQEDNRTLNDSLSTDSKALKPTDRESIELFSSLVCKVKDSVDNSSRPVKSKSSNQFGIDTSDAEFFGGNSKEVNDSSNSKMTVGSSTKEQTIKKKSPNHEYVNNSEEDELKDSFLASNYEEVPVIISYQQDVRNISEAKTEISSSLMDPNILFRRKVIEKPTLQDYRKRQKLDRTINGDLKPRVIGQEDSLKAKEEALIESFQFPNEYDDVLNILEEFKKSKNNDVLLKEQFENTEDDRLGESGPKTPLGSAQRKKPMSMNVFVENRLQQAVSSSVNAGERPLVDFVEHNSHPLPLVNKQEEQRATVSIKHLLELSGTQFLFLEHEKLGGPKIAQLTFMRCQQLFSMRDSTKLQKNEKILNHVLSNSSVVSDDSLAPMKAEYNRLLLDICSSMTWRQLAIARSNAYNLSLKLKSFSMWKRIKLINDSNGLTAYYHVIIEHLNTLEIIVKSLGGWKEAYKYIQSTCNEHCLDDTSMWPEFLRIKILELYRKTLFFQGSRWKAAFETTKNQLSQEILKASKLSSLSTAVMQLNNDESCLNISNTKSLSPLMAPIVKSNSFRNNEQNLKAIESNKSNQSMLILKKTREAFTQTAKTHEGPIANLLSSSTLSNDKSVMKYDRWDQLNSRDSMAHLDKYSNAYDNILPPGYTFAQVTDNDLLLYPGITLAIPSKLLSDTACRIRIPRNILYIRRSSDVALPSNFVPVDRPEVPKFNDCEVVESMSSCIALPNGLHLIISPIFQNSRITLPWDIICIRLNNSRLPNGIKFVNIHKNLLLGEKWSLPDNLELVQTHTFAMLPPGVVISNGVVIADYPEGVKLPSGVQVIKRESKYCKVPEYMTLLQSSNNLTDKELLDSYGCSICNWPESIPRHRLGLEILHRPSWHAFPVGMTPLAKNKYPKGVVLDNNQELVQLDPRFDPPSTYRPHQLWRLYPRPFGVSLPSFVYLLEYIGDEFDDPDQLPLYICPYPLPNDISLPKNVMAFEFLKSAGYPLPYNTELAKGVIILSPSEAILKESLSPVARKHKKNDKLHQFRESAEQNIQDWGDVNIIAIKRSPDSILPKGVELVPLAPYKAQGIVFASDVELVTIPVRFEVPVGVCLQPKVHLGPRTQLSSNLMLSNNAGIVPWPPGVYLPPSVHLVKEPDGYPLPYGFKQVFIKPTNLFQIGIPTDYIYIKCYADSYLGSTASSVKSILLIDADRHLQKTNHRIDLPRGSVIISHFGENASLPEELSIIPNSSLTISTIQAIDFIRKSQIVYPVKIKPYYIFPPGVEIVQGVFVQPTPFWINLPSWVSIVSFMPEIINHKHELKESLLENFARFLENPFIKSHEILLRDETYHSKTLSLPLYTVTVKVPENISIFSWSNYDPSIQAVEPTSKHLNIWNLPPGHFFIQRIRKEKSNKKLHLPPELLSGIADEYQCVSRANPLINEHRTILTTLPPGIEIVHLRPTYVLPRGITIETPAALKFYSGINISDEKGYRQYMAPQLALGQPLDHSRISLSYPFNFHDKGYNVKDDQNANISQIENPLIITLKLQNDSISLENGLLSSSVGFGCMVDKNDYLIRKLFAFDMEYMKIVDEDIRLESIISFIRLSSTDNWPLYAVCANGSNDLSNNSQGNKNIPMKLGIDIAKSNDSIDVYPLLMTKSPIMIDPEINLHNKSPGMISFNSRRESIFAETRDKHTVENGDPSRPMSADEVTGQNYSKRRRSTVRFIDDSTLSTITSASTISACEEINQFATNHQNMLRASQTHSNLLKLCRSVLISSTNREKAIIESLKVILTRSKDNYNGMHGSFSDALSNIFEKLSLKSERESQKSAALEASTQILASPQTITPTDGHVKNMNSIIDVKQEVGLSIAGTHIPVMLLNPLKAQTNNPIHDQNIKEHSSSQSTQETSTTFENQSFSSSRLQFSENSSFKQPIKTNDSFERSISDQIDSKFTESTKMSVIKPFLTTLNIGPSLKHIRADATQSAKMNSKPRQLPPLFKFPSLESDSNKYDLNDQSITNPVVLLTANHNNHNVGDSTSEKLPVSSALLSPIKSSQSAMNLTALNTQSTNMRIRNHADISSKRNPGWHTNVSNGITAIDSDIFGDIPGRIDESNSNIQIGLRNIDLDKNIIVSLDDIQNIISSTLCNVEPSLSSSTDMLFSSKTSPLTLNQSHHHVMDTDYDNISKQIKKSNKAITKDIESWLNIFYHEISSISRISSNKANEEKHVLHEETQSVIRQYEQLESKYHSLESELQCYKLQSIQPIQQELSRLYLSNNELFTMMDILRSKDLQTNLYPLRSRIQRYQRLLRLNNYLLYQQMKLKHELFAINHDDLESIRNRSSYRILRAEQHYKQSLQNRVDAIVVRRNVILKDLNLMVKVIYEDYRDYESSVRSILPPHLISRIKSLPCPRYLSNLIIPQGNKDNMNGKDSSSADGAIASSDLDRDPSTPILDNQLCQIELNKNISSASFMPRRVVFDVRNLNDMDDSQLDDRSFEADWTMNTVYSPIKPNIHSNTLQSISTQDDMLLPDCSALNDGIPSHDHLYPNPIDKSKIETYLYPQHIQSVHFDSRQFSDGKALKRKV